VESGLKNNMKFDFTKTEYEHLKEELMLNEEMAKILEMKIRGYSITKISMELSMSESTISRRIEELKKKIMKII
jgi:DNA-binding NarL/FixJ family response regulator